MFERMATGWELAKQSLSVLRQDKELLMFPVFSGVACFLVLASFAFPLWTTGWFQQVADDHEAGRGPVGYAILFAFYFCNYFVIVFFNTALVSCALKRMAGGDPTVGYGLQQAMGRLGQIAAWALVSATVGLILNIIESKSKKVGQFVASLLGAGWAIATYFVVPILVVEQVGPMDALKKSTSLIRKTWGEALVGRMGIGLFAFLAMLPGIALVVLGTMGTAAVNQPIWVFVGIGAGAVWILGVSLVSAAVKSILTAALYLYASEGTAPPQFDAGLLRGAFGKK